MTRRVVITGMGTVNSLCSDIPGLWSALLAGKSGVGTIALEVEFYRKFSVPLFALIMALISVPFAFLAGNRGAMAGVGISFGIAIAYWATNSISYQLGTVALLPAAAAAWAPDAVFALAGFYFFSRMRT